MSSVLAFLVLGVTLIAHWTHAVPYTHGTPTVVSQEVKLVLGHGPLGNVAFYVVQAATVLILYTGGNTSASTASRSWPATWPRTATCPNS